MNFQEILDRIKKTDGFEIIELNNENIYVYDIYEDRFLNYRNLDRLDFLQLFDFSSLKVEKNSFVNILKLLDKKLLMKVNKIYFIKSKDELNNILEIYPEQSMNIEKHLGINFHTDDVLIINAYLAEILAWEDVYYLNEGFQKSFNKILWETLIHELRHNITNNPIITEEEIPIEEGSEEKVEKYALSIFDRIISHNDYVCFKL